LGGSAKDPEVSPFLYPSHKGLAPALIQVCGMDPLRDEAFLYEKALKNDDDKTRLRV
jgi:acetyl esterase/lipase